ncbi:MAG TPA: hypothetical protein PJ982_01835, partial [Lacipirellulaceae bacterium]|nr:hypothetical protein [Lacipirellulaceae bacterium]
RAIEPENPPLPPDGPPPLVAPPPEDLPPPDAGVVPPPEVAFPPPVPPDDGAELPEPPVRGDGVGPLDRAPERVVSPAGAVGPVWPAELRLAPPAEPPLAGGGGAGVGAVGSGALGAGPRATADRSVRSVVWRTTDRCLVR